MCLSSIWRPPDCTSRQYKQKRLWLHFITLNMFNSNSYPQYAIVSRLMCTIRISDITRLQTKTTSTQMQYNRKSSKTRNNKKKIDCINTVARINKSFAYTIVHSTVSRFYYFFFYFLLVLQTNYTVTPPWV